MAEYADGLTQGAVRGRGAGLNPGNRFEDVRLHVLGEHLDEIAIEQPHGVQVRTRVYRDSSRSILNPVNSPDLCFKWSMNPYRGCEHGCIYCYARPGHEYLGMSSGLDFETKILAKVHAPEILRGELAKPKWMGEGIMLSGVTDCYQPVESQLKITRRILEVCAEFAQPVNVITKSSMITRDLDLLIELSKHHAVGAAISVTSLDNRLAAKMEPRASSPKERLGAVRKLADAGIPVAVMAAPIVPALNESEIPAILEAAKDAGASRAGFVLLRLPFQIKELFLDWVRRELPERAAHVESAIRDTRDGELYQTEWGVRQKGTGARAEQIGRVFEVFSRKLGLDGSGGSRPRGRSSEEFLRRRTVRLAKGQLGLFEQSSAGLFTRP
ncbi:MAG TPA: PA0069 family radical SAM protein [Phycisphaerales bacterium]|nr:PA0069 family radical SAM protein [Phycisphaerales bacterium]